MPALVVFGRRWHFGSDDFFVPATTDALFRTGYVLLFLLVWLTYLHEGVEKCPLASTFALMTLVASSVRVVLCVLLAGVSLRGTILNTKPRWPVAYICMAFGGLLLFELVTQVLGSIAMGEDNTGCWTSVKEDIFAVIVIFGWICFGGHLIALAFTFDPRGRVSFKDMSRAFEYDRTWEKRCRCLCSCAGVGNQDAWVYKDIAFLLCSLFRCIDVVPTDIAAALVLVRVRQRQRDKEREERLGLKPLLPTSRQLRATQTAATSRKATEKTALGPAVLAAASSSSGGTTQPAKDPPITSASPLSPRSKPVDWASEQERSDILYLSYYTKYMMASYGWMLYLFSDMSVPAACNLYKRIKCCGRRRQIPIEYPLQGDNFVLANKAALEMLTGLPPEDILYANFENGLFAPAYFIALDRHMHTVVLTIRGSISIQDALTDLVAGVSEVTIEGMEHGVRVHTGIWKAAANTYKSIEKTGILQQALSDWPDYQLVICGHSLGAGVAALLGLMFYSQYQSFTGRAKTQVAGVDGRRSSYGSTDGSNIKAENASFANNDSLTHENTIIKSAVPRSGIQVYSYSPPGGLMSAETAEFSKQFTTSCVLGRDLIPRLSLTSFSRLRKAMLNALITCTKNKWRVMGACCGNVSVENLMTDEDFVPTSKNSGESTTLLSGDCEVADQYTSETNIGLRTIDMSPDEMEPVTAELLKRLDCETVEQLYPPGRIVYLDRVHTGRHLACGNCCHVNSPDLYQVSWAEKEKFDEIEISPHMVLDHLPDNVQYTLRCLTSQLASKNPQVPAPTRFAKLKDVMNTEMDKIQLVSL